MKNQPGFGKALLSLAFVLGFVLLAAAQSPAKATRSSGRSAGKPSPVLGTWQGTFDGSASGKCELRFAREGSGSPTGQVSIQPDGNEPSPFIGFESVALEGNRVKATFTDGQGDQVQMDGTLDNDRLKGTWKTSAGQEGSFQATRAGKE